MIGLENPDLLSGLDTVFDDHLAEESDSWSQSPLSEDVSKLSLIYEHHEKKYINATIRDTSLAWLCRQASEKVFGPLYGQPVGADNMISSFDGLTYFRPSANHQTDPPWWHVDSNGPDCVQGVVLLTKCDATTGGFVCVPKSHKFFDAVLTDMKAHGKNTTKANFLPFDWTTHTMKKLFDDCGGPKLVVSQPGDIVLWSSKLVHSNTRKLRNRNASDPRPGLHGFDRLGFYTCLVPRPRDDEALARHRRQLFESGAITNHWPTHEMRAHHLVYPRAKSALPLMSAALPQEEILREFGDLI